MWFNEHTQTQLYYKISRMPSKEWYQPWLDFSCGMSRVCPGTLFLLAPHPCSKNCYSEVTFNLSLNLI